MTDPESLLPSRYASLVVQSVRWLRRAIADGVWSQHLPGERKLSERLGISRPTLRQALEQLERDGLIEVTPRKRRRIVGGVGGGVSGRSGGGMVGMLMPEFVLAQLPFQSELLGVARERLEKTGYQIESHASAACFTGRPAKALQNLVESNHVDVWMLVNTPPRVQRWFARQHVPCVVSGSCEPSTHIPSVDIDHGVACRHAVGVLARSGRKNIALILPKGRQPGDVDSENEFQQAVAEFPHEIVSQLIRHEHTVESLTNSLDEALSGSHPPDSFLVAFPPFALTTMMHLLKRGYRIPEDIALISRSDDPMLDYASPQVSCYRANAVLFGNQLADELIRVAEGGFGSKRTLRQLPVYVEGETVQ